MKRHLLTLVFVAAILSSCEKTEQSEPVAPVEKTVKYKIFAAEDYSAPVYSNVQATVTLSIGIAPNSTGVFTKIWDTVIAKPIREFPSIQQAIAVEKKFKVKEIAEQLQVAYSIRYDDNGQITQSSHFEGLASGINSILKEIDL